ncbi:matrixin family metalloprotease [Botrimarina sp.]|uniref:matrixin family metalloprotease n=1 Tax=Botrimarina sp. TaxID=2795802 RepID=UPI0032EBA03B
MPRSETAVFLLLAATLAHTSSADAAVAVLSNRSGAPVSITVVSDSGQRTSHTIERGDSLPLFSNSPLTVAYQGGAGPVSERLVADTLYWFAGFEQAGREGLDLRRIGLTGERPAGPDDADWRRGAGNQSQTVPVLLCVDEEEPVREAVWRERLAKRLRLASDILEAHSGVRFVPAGAAQWESDDALTEFERSLTEFEAAVEPPPATLAIGFTSQYRLKTGRQRLGGTRGPLRDHILLREWNPTVGEAERLELLVHELGHYLGAAHSVEPDSVMRPVLGNRPVRLKDWKIRFDPVNTLAIAMVGEEVRKRGVHEMRAVSAARKARLGQVYATLNGLAPEDPAAARMLAIVGGKQPPPEQAADVVSPAERLAAAAANVVHAVTRAAAANKKQSPEARLSGDDLTDQLIRSAAASTNDPRAFIVGIGVALDDAGGLHAIPRTKKLVEKIESAQDRKMRLNVLGDARVRGRSDTLKHFVISAALAGLVGEAETHAWGVGKELADAARRGGSGFSFADLAADRAGVRFARAVIGGQAPLTALAAGFRVQNYVPPLDGFDEGIPIDQLIDQYGGVGDPRFSARVDAIDDRIDSLPPYAMLRLAIPTGAQ